MNKEKSINIFKKIEEAKSGEKETKIVLIYGFSNKQLSDFIDHYKSKRGQL